MAEETHIVTTITTIGRSHTQLDNIVRPYRDQIGRVLGLMDGTKRWAYSLWRAPEGVDFWDVDKNPDLFLQAAGSASAMTVEVKYRCDDGEYRLFTVGKPGGGYSGEPSVAIPVSGGKHSTMVYPCEVFTAEEATDVFYAYFQTDRVPDQYPLREVDLTWPKPA